MRSSAKISSCVFFCITVFPRCSRTISIVRPFASCFEDAMPFYQAQRLQVEKLLRLSGRIRTSTRMRNEATSSNWSAAETTNCFSLREPIHTLLFRFGSRAHNSNRSLNGSGQLTLNHRNVTRRISVPRFSDFLQEPRCTPPSRQMILTSSCR